MSDSQETSTAFDLRRRQKPDAVRLGNGLVDMPVHTCKGRNRACSLLSLSHSCNQEPPASPTPGVTSRGSDDENSMTPPDTACTSAIGAAEYEQPSAAQSPAVVRAGEGKGYTSTHITAASD